MQCITAYLKSCFPQVLILYLINKIAMRGTSCRGWKTGRSDRMLGVRMGPSVLSLSVVKSQTICNPKLKNTVDCSISFS